MIEIKIPFTKSFIIAEAGSNWKVGTYEEDLEMAKKMIIVAAKSGADAIKFQTFRSKSVYAKNAGISNYLSKQGIDQNIEEIFDNLAMPYEMIPELVAMCKNENIHFMSTPFSVEDAKKIDPYVEIHKLASFEINHVRLIEFLASTKKPILISTGASTIEEIDFAINLCKKAKNDNIVLLQCTSKYPSPLSSINLSVIKTLREKYKVPVGFSDHSEDPIIAPILSIGFGSSVIEKHFTLNKKLSGPDHSYALEPNELQKMIESIRMTEEAIGKGKKEVLEIENELQQFAKRSLQAISEIKEGDNLKEGVNFEVLRPGNNLRGLEARFLEECNGRKATKDIKVGEGICDYK